MSVLRTGKHGTLSSGNVHLKGTLYGFHHEGERQYDWIEIEFDNAGGIGRFPANWTWTEDPEPKNVLKNVLKIGTRLQGRSGGAPITLIRVVITMGYGLDTPSHFLDSGNNAWIITPTDREALEDPVRFEVINA
jgi:hypothetical protein